jgi:two-component system response regulator YesN
MTIKTLLVEDETILRQGIASLIDWKSLDCEIIAACSNPIEAFKILKNHTINLIITDIQMPLMNGIEFTRQLSKDYPHIHIIILTAFSNFDYAKEAIDLNVLSYVLKTDFVKELPLAVEKNKSKILETVEHNHLSLEALDNLFLTELSNGKITDSTAIKNWFQSKKLNTHYYYIVLAEIIDDEYTSAHYIDDTILSNIQHFLDLAFKDTRHLTTAFSKNIILNILSYENLNNTDQILITCNNIISTVKQYMHFDLNLSISHLHSSPQEFSIAFSEAKFALENTYSNLSISIYNPDDLDKRKVSNTNELLLTFSNDLVYSILNKDTSFLEKTIKALFDFFENNKTNYEVIRFTINNLITYCFINLNAHFIEIEDAFNIQRKFANNILQTNSNYALSKLVHKTLLQIMNHQKNQANSFSKTVLLTNSYIQKNYSTNIKLEMLAQNANVSSSYLSRLYKKETGISIITYINKYRIEVAKKMIREGNSYISEIAYSVGFQDPAYFTNIFKKLEGKSPTQYYKYTHDIS